MVQLAIAFGLAFLRPALVLSHSAPDYSLAISGDGVKPTTLSLSELEKLDQASAVIHEHDGSLGNYEGPALFDVLKKAGVVLADHPGKAMSIYVDVVASDGYEVVFGLGEVAPTISGRTIILADRMNGKPLGANVGPVRLVVGGDKAQARCIRMVSEIKLVQLRK